jgi:hypothetical protein
MRVNGKMICKKDRGKNYGMMEILTKASIIMGKSMERVFIIGLMEVSIKMI